MTDTEKLENLIAYMRDFKEHESSYLIKILHRAQELFGWISRDLMDLVSREMSIPTSRIWGVATFYHHFNLEKPGKNRITFCRGTACYVNGMDKVLEAVCQELNIYPGQTTEDGLFSIHEARCLGACALSPVFTVNGKIFGNLTAEKAVMIIRAYKNRI